jgi:phosphatidylglycerophosphatase C
MTFPWRIRDTMNVYDFDKTIFRGDSTARFFAFCLKRHIRIARRLPVVLWDAALMALGTKDKTGFKGRLFGFLQDLPDVNQEVSAFWAKNLRHIQPWYKAQMRPDDLVISAGPEFLLAPVCKRLIASRVDPKTGAYTGKNCDGEEKLRRFRTEYGEAQIDSFYSDSLHDAPMAHAAKQAFLVKGDQQSPWPR